MRDSFALFMIVTVLVLGLANCYQMKLDKSVEIEKTKINAAQQCSETCGEGLMVSWSPEDGCECAVKPMVTDGV